MPDQIGSEPPEIYVMLPFVDAKGFKKLFAEALTTGCSRATYLSSQLAAQPDLEERVPWQGPLMYATRAGNAHEQAIGTELSTLPLYRPAGRTEHTLLTAEELRDIPVGTLMAERTFPLTGALFRRLGLVTGTGQVSLQPDLLEVTPPVRRAVTPTGQLGTPLPHRAALRVVDVKSSLQLQDGHAAEVAIYAAALASFLDELDRREQAAGRSPLGLVVSTEAALMGVEGVDFSRPDWFQASLRSVDVGTFDAQLDQALKALKFPSDEPSPGEGCLTCRYAGPLGGPHLGREPEHPVISSCASRWAQRQQTPLRAGLEPGLPLRQARNGQMERHLLAQAVQADRPRLHVGPLPMPSYAGKLARMDGRLRPSPEGTAGVQGVLTFSVHGQPGGNRFPWLPGDVWGVEVQLRVGVTRAKVNLTVEAPGEAGQAGLRLGILGALSELIAHLDPAGQLTHLSGLLWSEREQRLLDGLWEPGSWETEGPLPSPNWRERPADLPEGGTASSRRVAARALHSWFGPLATHVGLANLQALTRSFAAWPSAAAQRLDVLADARRAGLLKERNAEAFSKLEDQVRIGAAAGRLDLSGQLPWSSAVAASGLLGEETVRLPMTSVRLTDQVAELISAQARLQRRAKFMLGADVTAQGPGERAVALLAGLKDRLSARDLSAVWLLDREVQGLREQVGRDYQALRDPEELLESGELAQVQPFAQVRNDAVALQVTAGALSRLTDRTRLELVPLRRGLGSETRPEELLREFTSEERPSALIELLDVPDTGAVGAGDVIWVRWAGPCDPGMTRAGTLRLLEQAPVMALRVKERSFPAPRSGSALLTAALLARIGQPVTADPAFERTVREGGLDDAQTAAALGAQEAVSVIWGPPGTGKSSTLRVLCAAELARGGSVLLISNSYAAVDGVLEGMPRRTSALIGRVSSAARRRQLPGVLNWTPAAVPPEAPVMVGSVSAQLGQLPAQRFSLVVVDEASQVAASVLPLLAERLLPSGRLVSCGDDLQLPVIRDRVVRQVPLAAALGSLHALLQERGAVVRQLQVGYRSVPALTGVARLAGYPTLRAARSEEASVRLLSLPDAPATVLVHRAPSSLARGSKAEAAAVAQLVTEALQVQPALRVGVVTPHRAQRALVIEALRRGRLSMADDVDTADRFQGQERDLVVISPGVRRAVGANPFVLDAARVNVMLSRARDRMVLVVHADLAQQMRLNPQLAALMALPHAGQVQLSGVGDVEVFAGVP